MELLKKKTSKAFGKKIWLLGQDEDGINYWLEEPSWDCGWYWGFGYIETYTNNRAPGASKDINSHCHFDSFWGPEGKSIDITNRDNFKKVFKKTTLTDNEIWELCDYMKTFYTLSSVAELFKHGYSWQTERAKIESLESQEQNDLVNKVWLPEVFKRIQNIFEKE